MTERAFNPVCKLCFSRWSRKGYAIFASLGREVRIGALSIRVCEVASRKSPGKAVIVRESREPGEPGCFSRVRVERAERSLRVLCPARGDAGHGAVLSGNGKEKVRLSVDGRTFFSFETGW